MTIEQKAIKEFREKFDKVLKSDGVAIHFEDKKRVGLYYTSTTIGLAKIELESFLLQTIKETREEEINKYKELSAKSNEWWNKKLQEIINKAKLK
mgnify:CR=1 FL=1